MTGQEIAVKGRELALKDPVGGRPIAVDIEAEGLTVEFTTVEGLDRPTVKLFAAEDIISRTTRTFDGDTWKIRLPRDGRSYGGGTTVISNGSSIQVNSLSGTVFGARGRTVVNGVDVTDFVSQRRGEAAAQMPRAVVQVPVLSVLVARIDAGDITTKGKVRGVRADTQSGSLFLGDGVLEVHFSTKTGDLRTGSVGKVLARTMSGDIHVEGGNDAITASTMSGDVSILMLAAAQVMARSMSGDVSVSAAPGISLAGMVMADSMSGRVRAPR